jgi:thiosulfate/3-mercaptopyruvate sulfurtransferase
MGVVLSLAFGSCAMAFENEYPRGDLLLEPGTLAKPEIARQFVVLDARPRVQYDEGHIPGAVWVDAAAWAKAFGGGKDAAVWSSRIGGLGIGRDAKVALYDNVLFKDAARIWWILKYWGVEDARLLNGNWSGWKQAGLPVESGPPKAPAPAKFAAVPRSGRLAIKGGLLGALKDKSLQIVDSRSHAEFCGIDKMTNKRGGAMPGAKHLEWSDLIDKQSQRFKSPEQLRALFEKAGIDVQRSTATHCQSGGRASVMVFGMELMGASDVSNYYASWGEWGNAADTPIVIPRVGKNE